MDQAAQWAETGLVARQPSEKYAKTPLHEGHAIMSGARRILFPMRALLFAICGVCQSGLLSPAVVADSFVNGAK